MPRNPVNERLSYSDLEYLTDQIVMDHDDMSANEALMVLMDEILRGYFSDPGDLENVTGIVSRHAYYRLGISEHREQALISEAHAGLAQR